VYVLSPVFSGKGISRANQRQRRPSGFGLVEPAAKSGLEMIVLKPLVITQAPGLTDQTHLWALSPNRVSKQFAAHFRPGREGEAIEASSTRPKSF
jgi:hypothetical protein